jgi:prevent-host-death family protein
MKHVSVAEAKNRLPALIRDAESEPIEIRRKDEPAAVLVSIATYRRLAAKDRKRSVISALEAIRSAGGLPRVVRARTPGRKVSID